MKVLIVGGGLAGLALAPQLKRMGHTVSVVERQSMDALARAEERSINLTITEAGRRELSTAGLLESVLSIGTELEARSLHSPHGLIQRESYASETSGLLLSVKRTDLLTLLYREALEAGVPVMEQTSFESFDKASGMATVVSQGQSHQNKFDLIVGADGAFSQVRRNLLRGEPVNFSQTFFPWRYTKFDISSEQAQIQGLSCKDLHIWSTASAMIVGIPNCDSSVSSLLMFECLEQEDTTRALNRALLGFRADFSDLVRPLEKQIRAASDHVGHFVEVIVNSWVWRDQIVLMGDAAHAMYPFCGLGFNTAMGDVNELVRQLARPRSEIAGALGEYETKRRKAGEKARTMSAAQFSVLHRNWETETFAWRV